MPAQQDGPRWHLLLRLLLCWVIYWQARREHDELVSLVRACQSSALLQQEVQNMVEQAGLNWEQEIFLTALEKAEQAIEAEFTKTQRALLLKLLKQRFRTVPKSIRQKTKTASLRKLQAALERIVLVKTPEELTF